MPRRSLVLTSQALALNVTAGCACAVNPDAPQEDWEGQKLGLGLMVRGSTKYANVLLKIVESLPPLQQAPRV